MYTTTTSASGATTCCSSQPDDEGYCPSCWKVVNESFAVLAVDAEGNRDWAVCTGRADAERQAEWLRREGWDQVFIHRVDY